MEESNNRFDYIFIYRGSQIAITDVEGYEEAIDRLIDYINSRDIGTLYRIVGPVKRVTRAYVEKRFSVVNVHCRAEEERISISRFYD